MERYFGRQCKIIHIVGSSFRDFTELDGVKTFDEFMLYALVLNKAERYIWAIGQGLSCEQLSCIQWIKERYTDIHILDDFVEKKQKDASESVEGLVSTPLLVDEGLFKSYLLLSQAHQNTCFASYRLRDTVLIDAAFQMLEGIVRNQWSTQFDHPIFDVAMDTVKSQFLTPLLPIQVVLEQRFRKLEQSIAYQHKIHVVTFFYQSGKVCAEVIMEVSLLGGALARAAVCKEEALEEQLEQHQEAMGLCTA
jgi:hypothetical protein